MTDSLLQQSIRAAIVEGDEEKLYCLRQVQRIDPRNQTAVRGVKARESHHQPHRQPVHRGLMRTQTSALSTERNSLLQEVQEAPTVRISWEGWEEHSHLPTDTLENISADNLEEAGRTLAMTLMILGREEEY